jgi:hypothetical protein
MSNYSGVEKTQSEKFGYLPNVNLLMKISLGLILFTIISTALVYAETVDETMEETVDETMEETVDETMEEADTTTTPTQCGPGTVLKDGVCVLDERCGPGTVLEDGVCVLDSTATPTSGTSSKGMGKELIIGLVAGIAIAGTIGVVLAIISKASKSSD